jgi:hypothetical protein
LIGRNIIKVDIAIFRTPTPIRKARDEPEPLLDIPCIILVIPFKRMATAARIIRIAEVNIGNCISTIEKAIIARPSIIFGKLDLICLIPMPTHILSIPTASKITERIKINVKNAGPI